MKGVSEIVSVAIAAMFFSFCTTVFAQNTSSVVDQPVEAKGVGISGGVIAGAEVVLLAESIIDVKSKWAWWVFPILGAGGGGVGGYFLEQKSANGSVALLVGSMLLLIPTAVAMSVSRSYNPEDENAIDGYRANPKYSFEMDPAEKTTSQEASTEVEARPEGIPANADDSSATEEQPDFEAEEDPLSLLQLQQQEKYAHLTSGSLFHISKNLNAGFGLPKFDIRPTIFNFDSNIAGVNSGIEFHISLLKIDLP